MKAAVDRVGPIEFIAVGRLTMGRMASRAKRPVSQGEDSETCTTQAVACSELVHHPAYRRYCINDVV